MKKKLNSYKYQGPIELGSVMAHNCGAAGLFVDHTSPSVHIRAEESLGDYEVTLCIEGDSPVQWTEHISTEGRKKLGKTVLYFLRHYQGLDEKGPWGSLVGVRPTKLYHKLWDENASAEATKQTMMELYDTSEAVATQLEQIAKLQKPYLDSILPRGKKISLYSGIPFCESHCSYCSFPYGLIQNYQQISAFLLAYQKDIHHLKRLIDEYQLEIESLYMGGGTPTSLSDGDFETILSSLRQLVPSEREFTVEAGRPDSMSERKLDAMKREGVTRISINPQSMQDEVLQMIGRTHKVEDIIELYNWVREKTNFAINMDFIAGLPKQNPIQMVENLDYVCRMRPENVTIHTLALKKGSPLYNGQGRAFLPTPADVEEMVAYSKERLVAEGYIPYYLYRQQYMTGQFENIGYTLPGYECVYNIQMMEERQSILSIGPGSSSKWMHGSDYRQNKQHMPKDVDAYIKTIDTLLEKRAQLCKKQWEGE